MTRLDRAASCLRGKIARYRHWRARWEESGQTDRVAGRAMTNAGLQVVRAVIRWQRCRISMQREPAVVQF